MENTSASRRSRRAHPVHPQAERPVEDHAIEQYIIDSGRFLEEARVSTDICEVLYRYGFDDEDAFHRHGLAARGDEGVLRQPRGQPPGPQRADGQLKAKIAEARDDFDGFRLVARAVFPAAERPRQPAGDGRRARTICSGSSTWRTRRIRPPRRSLTPRNSPSAVIPPTGLSLHEFLDALAWLDAAHEAAAEVRPTPATRWRLEGKAERDAAYNELKAFMKEIKGVARAAFRKDPDTLAKLGLSK